MKRTALKLGVRLVPFVSILLFFITVGTYAATNSSFEFQDLTDRENSRFSEHLYIYTQSTSNPETFSVTMPEGVDSFGSAILGYDYDEFEITYQTSSAIGEWTEETVYNWRSMDGDTYPEVLYATLTGADANSIVYVYARDLYGE